MGLLQKLLSTLGLRESSSGRGSQGAGETTVTVEHEPDATSESAVKGTEGVSADTAASGSTATITDTADEEGGATEPSEAAGDAAGDLDEDVEIEDAEDDAAAEGDAADGDGNVDDADGDANAVEADEDESVDDADGGVSGAGADEDAVAGDAGSGESPDALNGIGPAYAERLENAGVESIADLAAADAGDLADETGLGEGRIANWIEQAKEY